MLGLVKTALHKPYTFIVLAIFICIIGPLAAVRTPTDVFPDIGIPVVAVVWQYTGLAPADMAGRGAACERCPLAIGRTCPVAWGKGRFRRRVFKHCKVRFSRFCTGGTGM